MRRLVSRWLPVVLMVAVMFYGSTDTFSPDHTRTTLERLLDWLAPGLSPATTETLNHLARKSAHVFLYALLTLLLWRAWRADAAAPWRASWAGYALLSVAVVAVLDEAHQAATITRHALATDVLLDVATAVLTLLALRARAHYLTLRSQAR